MPQQERLTDDIADNASRFINTLKDYRLPILLAGHVVLFTAIIWIAYNLRFEFLIPDNHKPTFWAMLPLLVGLKVALFYGVGAIHGWWRYVTFSDFITLIKAAGVSSMLLVVIDHFLLPGQQVPRSIILIDFVLTIVLVGGLRSISRVWDERIAVLKRGRSSDRALLIGKDFNGAKMAHLINSQPGATSRVVGLVSPTEAPRRRTSFSDLSIVGAIDDLENLATEYRVKTVFVPHGEISGKKLRELLDMASLSQFDIRIVNPLDQHLAGSDSLPVREVSVADLLRRDQVELDTTLIHHLIANKKVLVTGAGGSIGSELCRQIANFDPECMILVGRGENRIFHIERELRENPHIRELIPRIASVTDKPRMEEIFRTYQPDIVFHAAAHKHVPLVESNVGEAVLNNVNGTKILADMAVKYETSRFVLISTDKSVNPTSIMGCTKQMAERYCTAMGPRSKTKFIVTRFGNVLGSAGSVIPVFQKQIRKGGPITITDSRMTRFFMTIPEASQLVLQAAAMGDGGEIFVLEMGEQVRIEDMARDLIRLAGLPAGSIDIKYTGIRPGEKLYEELYYEDEEVVETDHPKILSSFHRVRDFDEVNSDVNTLIDLAFADEQQIRKQIQKMVPEFFVPEENSRPDPARADEGPRKFTPRPAMAQPPSLANSKSSDRQESHESVTK